MAVTTVTTTMAGAINYTVVTDTSADWPSVANSTYFYDKATKLVYFKDSTSTVLNIFSAGGLTKFTEAESTTSPNNTVYVDSLTAAGSTTNVDVAIVPKGTGAFMLDIPDGTAAGGNKRGANAVDLQTTRDIASRVASGANSFVAGQLSTASGDTGMALGYGANAAGAQSVALSNSQATASNAFSMGTSTISSGSNSGSIGSGNTSSGTGSFSVGSSQTASGDNAIAMGVSNTASGFRAVAIGAACIGSGDKSFAFGTQASTHGVRGRYTWSAGQEGVVGDSQMSIFHLRNRTTNATATVLYTDTGANTQLTLSNQSAYRFKGSIIGKKSGTTDIAAWDIDGLIVRGANAAATTLVVSNVNVVDNTPTWGTPALTADTTNGGLKVEVTGAAATNIQWTAVIETTEVIYA